MIRKSPKLKLAQSKVLETKDYKQEFIFEEHNKRRFVGELTGVELIEDPGDFLLPTITKEEIKSLQKEYEMVKEAEKDYEETFLKEEN
jgi:hypothetical protein